jgi:tungstate transport system substrate-binding protein
MKMCGALAALAAVLAAAAPAVGQDYALTVATTTSVEDSGLFAFLLPKFESRTGMKVRVLSRASSVVLSTAAAGGIDVVIVNDSDALDRFVGSGHAAGRHTLMYNDFVIAGPASDPAKVTGLKDTLAALRAIARQRAAFLSRGDESGTHVAEQRLWRAAGIEPKARAGDWYRQTGLGMGATVEMALRLHAYVLTDRATWLAHRASGDLRILVEADPRLFDQYEIGLVNAAKHPQVNDAAAVSFVDWIVSDEGQSAIAAFKIDGQPAFFPNARLQN